MPLVPDFGRDARARHLAKGPVAPILCGASHLIWIVAEAALSRDRTDDVDLCDRSLRSDRGPVVRACGVSQSRLPAILFHRTSMFIATWKDTEHGWGPWFFIPIVIGGTWPWFFFVPHGIARFAPEAGRASLGVALSGHLVRGDFRFLLDPARQAPAPTSFPRFRPSRSSPAWGCTKPVENRYGTSRRIIAGFSRPDLLIATSAAIAIFIARDG